MSENTSSAHAASYRLPDGRIPVLLSSDAAELLTAEAAALRDYARTHPDVPAEAIATQVLRTRPARRYRALAAVTDTAELVEALDSLAHDRPHPAVIRGTGAATRRRVAYTYPGQGSQRPGMGRQFYNRSEAFRRAVDACHEQSLQLFGSSPRDYVLGDLAGDDAAVSDVRVVQPGLFMQMVGLTAMWDAAGAVPAMTLGHSQGEIAAAYRSGVMTLSDALAIVTVRARLVHELSPRGHTMAVVGIDVDECEALLARHSGWAQLSVVNSAHILCVSGRRESVLEIVDMLTAQGKFAKEIRVEYPAHTSVVSDYQPAFIEALGTYLEHGRMLPGDLPCIGATLGEAVDESMTLGDYWFWNLRNRVRFDKAVAESVTGHGADFFIELSEHPTLILAVAETLSGLDEASPADRPVIGSSRRDAVGLEEFTRSLATLAVADTGFRWDALATDDDGPRWLPLEGFPNTVMRRMHLWADRDAGMTDEVNSPEWATARSGGDVQRLVSRWQPLKRRKLLAPRTIAVLDPTGQCAGPGAEICAAAGGQGAVARIVDDPGASADVIDTAVLLVGPTGTKPDEAAELLAQVLADAGWRAGLETLPEQFWWVTIGGEQVTDDDPVPDPLHGPITAALRCAAAEYPTVRFRHLDLDPTSDVPVGDRVISAVHVADEPELAQRDGTLYVKRLESAEPADHVSSPDTRHILITGGTGRLGMEFCRHYAAAAGRAGRITLISRSGDTPETARRLDALRAQTGTVIDVIACDITDESAVQQMASALPEPVTMMIHTAMTYVETPVDTIDRTQIAETWDAKVTGPRRVLAHVPAADDLHVLLCSSLAASLGGRGQALYAMANRMVDITAADLRADGFAATAIQWGLWQVQGPLDEGGVARVRGAGVIPMVPAAALRVGFADLATDSVVLSADWAELRDLLTVFGYQAVLPDIPGPAASPRRETPPAEPPAGLETVDERDTVQSVSDDARPAAAASIGDVLRAELATAMGLTGTGDELDPETPLVALGLDSLQALDLRRRVKNALGQDVPVEAILGGASLREIVDLMR
ncbi:nocobactin polyketide synthase NbtC [Gordonia rhizosphera]|uniref:Putative polyketide synthase n=1 Tax=Gordonia rhizosphera NBRC 16068 TaxID=1108045 RepID=K6W9B5_9ACTN|nr:nocobactin polyketide synthase NbtC [Gordonia rhizosphera]GAB90331.1 putative polyketide synthase [Gordonia rhizosphera NBRC 16068]